MRNVFASDKRASNLARHLRHLLADGGHERSMNACREAVATSTGYRNWNELLKISGKQSVSPFDEDVDDSEAMARMTAFSLRLAKALDLPSQAAAEVTSRLRPFAAPGIRSITDDHIALMSANITALGYPVRDLSSDGYAAFELTIPERTVQSDGRDILLDARTLEIHVRLDGAAVYNDERRSSFYDGAGYDSFSKMLEYARLQDLTQRSRRTSALEIDPIVHQTFKCLDKKALLIMRLGHTVNRRAYRDAFALPSDSPILREAVKYPVIARQFGELSLAMEGDYFQRAGEDADRIFSDDPVGSFTTWIEDRSKELWPNLPLDPRRVRAAVEHYLSVPMKDAGVDPDAATFLCHVPSKLWPKTSGQLDACVDFVDRHKHIVRPISKGGMGALPTTFGEEFERRANGDWEEMARKSTVSYMAFHRDVGSDLIAGAAREAGYEAFAAQFEQGRRGDISEQVALTLLSEIEIPFFDVIDFHARYDAAIKERIGLILNNRSDYEIAASEDADFERNFEFGLIHSRHRGRSKTEILSSLGFDVHAIVDIDVDDWGDEQEEEDSLDEDLPAATY